MRVLFVLGSFPELSESFIINQIVSLIDLGVEVDIFSYNIGKNRKAYSALVEKYKLVEKCVYLEKEESLYKRLLSFGGFLLNNIGVARTKKLSDLRLFYQYQDILLKNDYDIIHSHYGTVGERFSKDFQNTSFFKKSKKICTFHGWDILPTAIEKLQVEYSELIKYFDAFTYNTPYLGDILLDLDRNIRTYELPVGIHLDFLNSKLKKKFDDNGIFKILFCGRLVKWKGCLQIIEIAKVLKDKGFENWQIEIIGDGPEFENLTQKIEENSLQSHVFILGKQPQDVVFDTMNNSDVFLLPGIYDESTRRAETQGLVIQEAQFFYLPVVISNAGGAKYGVVDQVTGFVLDYEDIDGFADRLIYLMSNKNMIKIMGEKGHEYVISNFSTKILAEKLLTIYNEVLK